VAQGEEEEQSLLLAHSVVLDAGETKFEPPTAPSRRLVHIKEQRVFVDLGLVEECDNGR
jgi:hypothetical protein